MNDSKKIENLKQRGWKNMEGVLAQNMPVGRPKFPWNWLAIITGATLAILVPLYFQDGRLSDSPDNVLLGISDTIAEYREDLSINLRPEGPVNDAEKDYETISKSLSQADIIKIDDETPDEIRKIDSRISRDDLISPNEEVQFDHHISNVQETDSSEVLPERPDDRQIQPEPYPISDLPSIAFRSYSGGMDLSDQILKSISMDKQKKTGFRLLAFSESMWSPWDHMMYLQLGPGVSFQTKKWNFDLLIGPSFTIPGIKSFDYSNDRFADQYFVYTMGSELQVQRDIRKEYTYYESYESKTGVVFSGSVGYAIHPRWSLSVESGYITRSYNLRVEAYANPYFPVISYVTGISNHLLYAGLNLSYDLNDHFMILGGFTNLNFNSKKNRVILPKFGIQYRL